jgi:hypothetical protein
MNKFSLVAIEALLNLGVKMDELTKLIGIPNVEWYLIIYISLALRSIYLTPETKKAHVLFERQKSINQ